MELYTLEDLSLREVKALLVGIKEISIKGIDFTFDDEFYIFELRKITDISKIISALNEASIEILDMETVDQDLENIFLKLTGKV